MLTVTATAIQQLQSLIGFESTLSDLPFDLSNDDPSDKKKFRLGVIGGGCSGFQYKFSLESKKNANDLLFKHPESKLEILVEETALDFIKGATLDYLVALGKRHFIIQNPNATSKCGCGSSFNI